MELYVFSGVLVLSVIAHYLLWRSSKKQYDACLKQAKALKEQLLKLEEHDAEIDGMLDKAEIEAKKIGDEIDALRSTLFVGRKRAILDN